MLKIAGSMQYQMFWNVVDRSETKLKSMKIPINEGMTSKVPNKYQPLRLPHGQLSLSESVPTMGVVTPSVIYPLNKASATI